jgi:succinoglycan biosynthesis protein ExoM
MSSTPQAHQSGLIAICSRDAQHYLRTESYEEVARQILRLNEKGGSRVDLVIVDNSGRGPDETHDDSLPMVGNLIYEKERGIPFARNMALAFAKDGLYPWMLFTDDDVLPSPDWLQEMIAVLYDSGADVVQGPWRYEYPADYDPSLPRLYDTKWEEGEALRAASTANVIFWTKPVWDYGLSFDTKLSETGGSDTKFFGGLRGVGCQIYATTKGWVTEPIIGKRATLKWHLVRQLRVSQSYLIHVDPKLSRIFDNRMPSGLLSFFFLGAVRGITLMGASLWFLTGSARGRKSFFWRTYNMMPVLGFLLLKMGIQVKEYRSESVRP